MIKQKLSEVSIAARAWSILGLFAIGLFANTLLNIAQSREHMRENYERGVSTLVESASGVAKHYYQLYQSGQISESEAQGRALQTISAMRFDGDNYIFVGDSDGVQLASGVLSLLGKNILGLKDSEGKFFVQELYQVARNGGGFVDYSWKNPDSEKLDPKTSYALMFQPWGWMIGSGMNMVALQADMHRSEVASAGYAISILAVLSITIGFFIKTITSPIKRTVRAMQTLSKGEGDLTQRLPEEGSKELVLLSRYFNQFVASVQGIMLSISDAGSQVSSAANQLSNSVHHIDDSLNQQQSDVDMLATAMTEMLATVEEVAARTVEANDASRLAAQEANHSHKIIDKNVQEANELAEQIQSASQVVQKLASDARNVDTVLEVIRGVAEQTNLLALNAAIEAARAGEQGRGFAVVADEVRSLSLRTHESTLEIQNIVEKLQVGAENVVKVMDQGTAKATNASELSSQAGEALNKINKEVHTIEEMNQHIATAAEEQTVTVNDINRNVVSLSDMASTVSGESTQMASSSKELGRVSDDLMAMINRFKLA
ncbi:MULTISPECIES: methyl-accepting chemotaxis protein [Vibrio]|uniref:methyl-accepting chemotaxis protein n=1 Tax=Vibrio TaxID=662 RepID=UPI0001B94A36|nr:MULTISPECIES: methyl-accepting chemotaxis protein [Vibrio]EEX32098.1 methyl-accepting chemotaxis protein [Vibrio coralliilyticus ATCC BAA-450]MDE3896724.1 methyl-accepting chemotaxis protein [Vibrio sp. CC007]QFT39600.1 Methyl-accepting chemotaxis protein 4 [Vibrio sp. THAF64]QGM37497.1 Methyl-accepting chemotaxis protein 4 [Vibrio sp. THAF191d]QGN72838.1 Methyl-accepting chemotaxis protein 4 [Vibrio sp. THAF191c]